MMSEDTNIGMCPSLVTCAMTKFSPIFLYNSLARYSTMDAVVLGDSFCTCASKMFVHASSVLHNLIMDNF